MAAGYRTLDLSGHLLGISTGVPHPVSLGCIKRCVLSLLLLRFCGGKLQLHYCA
jgi:hypothetical protein